jgi:hypothetical protein
MDHSTPCLIAALIIAGWGSSACAASIMPTAYVETPPEGITQSGTTNYFDDTGRQLIDGIIGADNYLADLGKGKAYEWVAWRVAEPVITFQFDSVVHFDNISIGFNRNDGSLVRVQQVVNIGGTPFSLPREALPNNTRAWIDFPVDITASKLTVSMTDGNTTLWLFVDEIRFNGTVPEPLATSILGLGFVLLTARRSGRRKN